MLIKGGLTSQPSHAILPLYTTQESMQVFDSVFILQHWSTNFQSGQGPFSLFLDIIGWSEEQLGENITTVDSSLLGYKEIGLLADALLDYSNYPNEVMEYANFLIECEVEGIDVSMSDAGTALAVKQLEACYAQ